MENVSRSEKKRQFKHTEEIAQQLVELSVTEVKRLPCSEVLKSEIRGASDLKGGARKRQVKYVAKMLRQESREEIYQFLESRKGSQLRSRQQLHEAERLRDALINEAMEDFQRCLAEQLDWEPDWESETVPALLKRFPEINEGDVRKSVYGFVKSRNRMYYRELFRIVKGAMDREEAKRRLSAS